MQDPATQPRPMIGGSIGGYKMPMAQPSISGSFGIPTLYDSQNGDISPGIKPRVGPKVGGTGGPNILRGAAGAMLGGLPGMLAGAFLGRDKNKAKLGGGAAKRNALYGTPPPGGGLINNEIPPEEEEGGIMAALKRILGG